MITLISGTNRSNSRTEFVADVYKSCLDNKQVAHKYLKLTQLPPSFLHNDMYADKASSFMAIQETYMFSASKFIFIAPEYNGSIPGILKLFIDGCNVKDAFHNKKACLMGVAAGRAGNIRGLDHMTGIMQHVKVTVMPHIIPASSIEKHITDNKLSDDLIELINKQIDAFIEF